MKTGNRLATARRNGGGRGGWKEGEGSHQRTCMNDHGQRQWSGDGLWESGTGWDGGGKRGGNWDNGNKEE